MFTLVSVMPYLLVPLMVALTDFVTVSRSKKAKAIKHNEFTKESSDFSILIPIFGNISYLKNVGFLKEYGNHVILCTTTKESDEFNDAIEQVADEHDFRIFRSPVPLASSYSKPNPWKVLSGPLQSSPVSQINSEIARDEIIRDSFEAVTSKYCIFLDGDTVIKDSVYKLTGLMEEMDYDIASVRVLASKQNTMIEKLQAIEYELAMDARKIYPWLTSGAGVVAKTEAIKTIMKHHSLFFSGGDIEIGKLAGLLGYKVGHLHFEFYTDVPETFKAWFKQRMAWFGGGFRHAIINWHKYTWRHPYFYIYTTVIVYGLTPLRWYEIIKTPEVLPLVIGLYWILILLLHRKKWRPYMLLFPFYALLQVMVLIPLGVYTYFKMAFRSNNSGMIALRHEMDYV